jgi:Tfp pilus assembly protein PilF
VLVKSPNLTPAHRTLAALYLQTKQLKKAQQHLTSAIKNGVQDAQFFGQLAYINLNQYSPWSAIAGYQQALLLEPQNLQWKKGLLYALQRAGNNQAALTMVDELINASPDDKDLWLQRAQITLATNDRAKALTSMEMALRYGEQKPKNLLSAAQLHLSVGSIARAADLLIDITKTDPQAFTQIASTISWLVSENELTVARKILASVKEITTLSISDQSLYYATLGNTVEPNDIKQALKYFKKSLSLNPNQASVLIKLAQHYQHKQQFSRAQLYYQRAQVFPHFVKQSLTGLAQLALDQQHYAQALDYLEKLKPLSDNKQGIEKNISIIKRLKAQQS